jgi:hypothetical protein
MINEKQTYFYVKIQSIPNIEKNCALSNSYVHNQKYYYSINKWVFS